MKQMEEQFAKMPPKQRAMMEKMMKGKMPGMPGKSAIPTIRVEATGQGRWKLYSCKNYTIYYDDRHREEICAAPPNEVKGADEVLQAVGNMREFQKKLTDAMPQFTSSNAFSRQIEAMNPDRWLCCPSPGIRQGREAERDLSVVRERRKPFG